MRKKAKKGLAGAVVAVMALTALSATVLADDGTTASADDTNVYTLTREVDASSTPYIWTMPTSISWQALEGDSGVGLYEADVKFSISPVSGEKYIILASDKTLNVNMDVITPAVRSTLAEMGLSIDDGEGVLTTADYSNIIKFAAYDNQDTKYSDNARVLSIESGSEDAAGMDLDVTFRTLEAAKVADTYSSSVSFTISIADTVVSTETADIPANTTT